MHTHAHSNQDKGKQSAVQFHRKLMTEKQGTSADDLGHWGVRISLAS